jgi:hypothetical protein
MDTNLVDTILVRPYPILSKNGLIMLGGCLFLRYSSCHAITLFGNQ